MRNRSCRIAVLCLNLLILAAGNRLWAASLEQQQWAETQTKLKAEGWSPISEGVFERRLGPGKVEHLGYGREGLVWTVGELRRQLDDLKERYQSYPSEDLANVIDHLNVKITLAEQELRNTSTKGMASLAAASVTGASCSSICYSATADAYPLTTVPGGVGAVADAKFNSACGYSGDTYAYAYAIATQNGTTTTVIQEDPHTGTNVTSHAAASVNGGSIAGTPCYSSANAYAQSSALGISYSTSDTNSSCPVVSPPTTVAISGPSEVDFTTATCANETWSSTTSNCTAPVTYQWKVNGSNVGTGSSYTRNVCYNSADFTLSLTATCSNGSATDSRSVTVVYDPGTPNPPPCGGLHQPICP